MVKKLGRTASAALDGGWEWPVNINFGRFQPLNDAYGTPW